MDETLIAFGSEIKALEDTGDRMKIGGHLVLFGSPEQTDATKNRDFFTKATDFDIPAEGARSTVYYHHGLNPALKARKLGTATLRIDDVGVWMEAELAARDGYEAKILEMVRRRKLGLSSGTASHLVQRFAMKNQAGETVHEVTLWPLGLDASLTPTPGEPRTLASAMKSIDELEGWTDELKEWSEANHPRDEQGRFANGGNGGGANASAPTVTDADIDAALQSAHKTSDLNTDKLREHLAEAVKGGTLKSPHDLAKAVEAYNSGAQQAVGANHLSNPQAIAQAHPQGVKKLARHLGIKRIENEVKKLLSDGMSEHEALSQLAQTLPLAGQVYERRYGHVIPHSAKSLGFEVKAAPPFKFCSTQINLPADIGARLIEWTQKNIPDDALAEGGREDQPHITVLYGLEDDDRATLQKLAAGFGPIRCHLGCTDIFEAEDYDVVYCRVDSPDLHRLRGRLETLPHTSTHPEYQPHATLAYVKKGMGKCWKDRYPFFDEDCCYPSNSSIRSEFALDAFYVSDKQGELQPISTAENAAAKTLDSAKTLDVAAMQRGWAMFVERQLYESGVTL